MIAFKNILVVSHSSIGDVCCDLAVINPLRKQFPQAKISILTSSRAAVIAQGYKGIDKIITFDKHGKNKGLAARLRLIATLRKERYELAVVLKSSLMYKFLNIPHSWSVRTYLGCLPSQKGIHAVDSYLEFLRFHDIDAREAQFDFVSSKEDKDFCDMFLAKEGIVPQDKVVGILPLAGWSLKSWPTDKWNKLAQILKKDYNVKVIAFGDSNDAFFKQIVIQNISPEIILTGKTDLRQAVAIIRRCNLFIAPDSGLLHLASVIGINSIGLYGPSPQHYVYPYFHRDKIVSCKEKLECMPCYPSLTGCWCKKKNLRFGDCMERISVDDILEIVRQELNLQLNPKFAIGDEAHI